MLCNCINEVNKKLSERQGGKLQCSIVFPRPKKGEKSPPAYLVPSFSIYREDNERRETRNGKAGVFFLPSYCPFCGQKYEGME